MSTTPESQRRAQRAYDRSAQQFKLRLHLEHDADLLAALDRARGDMTRGAWVSAWFKDALRAALEKPP
ncbi:MAG: hypothetical protein AAFR28_03555 [Pseudomonadota bacterium]